MMKGSTLRSMAGLQRQIVRSVTGSALAPRGSRAGPGGIRSNSGIKVAIFGATGLLGRSVTEEFGSTGSTAYIANRGDDMEHRHLKPFFELGNCAFYFIEGRDENSIRECIDGANVVVNMMGKNYNTKHFAPRWDPTKSTASIMNMDFGNTNRVNYSLHDVNVLLAERVARIAKECGVANLIHVSALTASHDSNSEWCRTKAQGEDAVLEAFPEATIVRPGTLFGTRDWFLNWYAWMGERFAVPLLSEHDGLVHPTYVCDVAEVIRKIAEDAEGTYEGKVVELAGPAEYTRGEIADFVKDITMRNPLTLQLPQQFLEELAWFVEVLPDPYITQDMIRRWGEDEVFTPKEGVFNFSDFNIEPTPIEAVAFKYLHRFRRGSHFDRTEGYHQ